MSDGQPECEFHFSTDLLDFRDVTPETIIVYTRKVLF